MSKVFVQFSLLAFVAGSAVAATNPPVDFQSQVRPILSDKCFLCHGPDKGTRMADLRLDVEEGALASRKNGRAIVPGKPDESLLIKRVFSDDPAFRMPPTLSHRTLTPEQKDKLRRWIEQGAKWKQHWAFVPPVKPAVPAVKNGVWAQNQVDHFILSKLEDSGLTPAAEADRRTLIRRVTLDLTGLPPTPQEVTAFVKDKSQRAYENVVDRLLASPHYGEHRARYWLDAARYADTQGMHFDNYREMWPYRDWVIKQFNANTPFDRFTVEQLAGDLLPHPTLDQKIASGFQRNNVTTNEGGSILPEVEAMYAKDRADTTGAVWLGLTVGCATCHDHKFDPILQKEYYSLTAFFRNTTQPTMDMNVPDTPPTVYVPLASDRAKWDELIGRRDGLRNELAAKRDKAAANTQAWIASLRDLPDTSSSDLLTTNADETLRVTHAGSRQTLELPKNVRLVDAPDMGGKAVRFDKGSTLELPNVAEVDTKTAFSVSTWIYMPKADQGGSVASQYGTFPGAGTPEKQRGWRLAIDNGNLGIYERAPSMYLMCEGGKLFSARASPNVVFKSETWYHVIFSYDGSGQRRGLTMYVNGAPVVVLGRPEEVDVLPGSIKSALPLTLGDKKGPEGLAIGDFKILNRAVDAEDAQLLYSESRVSGALKKPTEQLSVDERAALATYYTYSSDSGSRETVEKLHKTEAAWDAIRKRAATTFVMQERADAQPVAHVLYRGQYDQMRDEVHPNTPGVLPPMTQAMPANRLGLAMWIVDPSNPLTARVTVNRFWQEVFGNGIVKTTEDFGSQGEPPTHPELLDWLAVDFRDSGWNVKRLFKTMVMSATYRQSAQATPEKIARDPDNRLLARGPRFRMDAEMIRDYALFASGLLRPEVGGPSVKPYQPSHIWDTVAMNESNTRIYQQGTGSALYRRSIYTFWKRAAPPPSMDIFNAPSRETCTVRRERTNTPLQALVTMNDEQFVEAARVLAQSALDSTKSFDREADFMAARLLARPLDSSELGVLRNSYRDFLTYYASAPQDAAKLVKVGEAPLDEKLPDARVAAMTMVANELMNLDEVLVK